MDVGPIYKMNKLIFWKKDKIEKSFFSTGVNIQTWFLNNKYGSYKKIHNFSSLSLKLFLLGLKTQGRGV